MSLAKVANPLGSLQPLEAMAFGKKSPTDLLNPTNIVEDAKQSVRLNKPSSILQGDEELKTERQDREYYETGPGKRKTFVSQY